MSDRTRLRPSQPDSIIRDRPSIGDAAPAFDATTTKGLIHFPQDYLGRWVILFSHAADFTPVCTSELLSFSRLTKECRRLNTAIIGLSVDSLSSHVAWLYAIREQIRMRGLKNATLDFPLIADLSRTIAQRYGMIHRSSHPTQTVRAVFFIDPDGIIRTILYYPPTVGRNFDEIMRILISLQTADAFHVLTPADWNPGEPVVVSDTAGSHLDDSLSDQAIFDCLCPSRKRNPHRE